MLQSTFREMMHQTEMKLTSMFQMERVVRYRTTPASLPFQIQMQVLYGAILIAMEILVQYMSNTLTSGDRARY